MFFIILVFYHAILIVALTIYPKPDPNRSMELNRNPFVHCGQFA